MKVKSFLVAGIVGGIVDFLLGWLFYGILFKDTFPMTGKENMLFIFLGCMSLGFMMSFIYTSVASINIWSSGLKKGAIIGLFLALYTNFFMNANSTTINYNTTGLDVAITVVMTSLLGAVIALINGKLK